ncbi:SAM-dependent methyltransferase [Halobacteriales archaeon QS_8_69_26]|nr:MAG: SAM-dependent methyltransferase [Halobacteriales archaeon QS_8_69_26]
MDPDELSEYVDGGVHPAVVARVLEEHAVDLGVVERADGTFVPVPDGPHDGRGPLFGGGSGSSEGRSRRGEPVPGAGPGRGGPDPKTVEALPEPYVRRVEDLLVTEFGRDWHRGESGDGLRERIRRVKEDYYRNREVEYDRTAALGYAVYHLVDYYAAVQYVLAELVQAKQVPRQVRVLDVGAGVGGPALGVHDLLFGPPDPTAGSVVASEDGPDLGGGSDDGLDAGGSGGSGGGSDGGGDRNGSDGDDGPPTPPALVDYHAVEPSAAADVLDELLDATDPNFRPTVHRTTAEAFDPDGSFDLILFSNVLNELDDPTAVARHYLNALAPEGSLVATAPADRRTSVGLRSVERSLADDGPATVFSPTVRLWPDRSPTDECWSFAERPPVAAPPFARKLDEAAESEGEFTKTAVRYSYATLRVDGRRRIDYAPDPDRFAPMAGAGDYVTDRIDLVGVKLSPDLAVPDRGDERRGSGEGGSASGDGDHNPLFLVGDGSQSVDHYAVLVRETSLNRHLRTAAYGDLLVFDGTLALWNDDEGAYNLVVDEETVVDGVPAGIH